jgi:uncharacterized protein GlcG (DUF336 family)
MGLTLQQAEAVVAAAKQRASELGVACAIAVVDSGGHLVAFAVQDSAMLVVRDLAIGKAYTSNALLGPTSSLSAAVQPGGPFYGLADGHAGRPLVTFAGGQPLGDPVVGAVGVSGGTLDQDEDISLVAAAAVSAGAGSLP